MEGGAEAPPENVRICATSNRRHLVREVWSDRGDVEHNGDIHRSDTVEEKLSLASRFGLQIFYRPPPSRNTSRSSPRFRKRRGQTSRRNSSGPQPPPGRSAAAAVPAGRPGSSWTSWSIELIRCNCEVLSVLISVYLHVFGE